MAKTDQAAGPQIRATKTQPYEAHGPPEMVAATSYQ